MRARRSRRSAGYDDGHAHFLAHGIGYFDDEGWGSMVARGATLMAVNQPPFTAEEQAALLEDMRRAWSISSVRDMAMAERTRVYPGTPCWAQTVFELEN